MVSSPPTLTPAVSSAQLHRTGTREPGNPSPRLLPVLGLLRHQRAPLADSLPLTAHPQNEGRTEGVVPTATPLCCLRLWAQGRGRGLPAIAQGGNKSHVKACEAQLLVQRLLRAHCVNPAVGGGRPRARPAHPSSRDQYRALEAGSARESARAFSRS